MKKFLIKIIAFALIIFTMVYCINARYITITHDDSDYTQKFKTIPNNIEICNFGSSHGLYGYDYSDYNDTYSCFNFGLVSQVLSYDYNLLDYYQNNLAKGCTVFISVSYFSFIGIDETETDDFESKNQRYYKILDSQHIKEYSLEQKNLSNTLPVLKIEPNTLVVSLLKPSTSQHAELFQIADDIDLAEDVKAACNRHLITNKLDENGNYIINQHEIDALYSIIELCQKNGYKPVLVTTPFLKEYTDQCHQDAPEGVNVFYNILNEVVENTGVNYYDYSCDSRFTNRHDLFMNGDHLNQAGAKEFTDVLIKEVIEK